MTDSSHQRRVVVTLLRAIAKGTSAKEHKHDIIFTQAAEMIERTTWRPIAELDLRKVGDLSEYRILGKDATGVPFVAKWEFFENKGDYGWTVAEDYVNEYHPTHYMELPA